jgi:hypothetical protein
MTEEIIRKLTNELTDGICTEVQVVYVLAGIRKIIERDDSRKERFPWLNFHCDWALHSQLDRKDAKTILKLFDAAQPLFKEDDHIWDFPNDLQREITRVSKLALFKDELFDFLDAYGLPRLAQPYGWTYFQYLYAQVIRDIPLVVKDPTLTTHISRLVVSCELAKETLKRGEQEHQLFKVSWNIFDKNDQCGEFYVINGFDVPPPRTDRRCR